ncbi:DNA (cytosine-5)-methyltransferase DRM2 [Acorus calamus]|uniref:DNA (cytosine-5-)-methyltransferase n=1 Tax=Acorus calamus TaxID=4465 RepID=A0AAV9FTN3_ACOCL|nr:DNA (cytosine-5)-methyltransferase DRM2 [Acorus calamus]
MSSKDWTSDSENIDNISWESDEESKLENSGSPSTSNVPVVEQEAAAGPSRVGPADASCSKLLSHFVGMGFAEDMVAKVIDENGEGDVDTILETLLTYKVIGTSATSHSSEIEKKDTDEDFSDISSGFSHADYVGNEIEDEDISEKDKKLLQLVEMGFSTAEAASAVDRCGQDASILELADSIHAAQLAEGVDGHEDELSWSCWSDDEEPSVVLGFLHKPRSSFSFGACTDKKRVRRWDDIGQRKRVKMYNHSGGNEEDEDLPSLSLPNPMIGFGLPNDEIEVLLGFPRNHTRGGGSSRTERYRSLGNSFQVDTVAYHFSVLKDLFPNGITLLSLFSGIGGAEVALHRLGIHLKAVVCVEISEVNRNIVRSWWEQTNQTGTLIDIADIQQLNGDRLEQLIHMFGGFDLVVGGSPCNNLTGSNRVSRDGLGVLLSTEHDMDSADVILRGYGGYNTRWALFILNHIFPLVGTVPPIAVTIFFGANDAALLGRNSERQHVPVEESVYGEKAVEIPERTNEVAGIYAKKCIEVAQELGLPHVDLWSRMQETSGWQKKYLSDGLHLTEEGNGVVYEEVIQVFERSGLKAVEMPYDLPHHSEIDGKNMKKVFKLEE